MTGPQKYTKKPVEIEAMQLTPTNAEALLDWVTSFGPAHVDMTLRSQIVKGILVIHTLEGDMLADVGDFIIRGTQGEFYPCKPDIFRAIHEMPGEAPVVRRRINFPPTTITIDTLSGQWLEPKPSLTHEQAIRVAASVLPGVSMDQLALWYDEVMFDSGPKQ